MNLPRNKSDSATPDARRGMPGTFERLARLSDARKRKGRWRAALSKYEKPDNRKGLAQATVTFALYGAAWALLLETVTVSYWLTAAVALPAGGLTIRLIAVQHDCGHGSYLTSRKACDWLGRVAALLVLQPYAYINKIHLGHHAHLGNLDIRAGGEPPLLTVDEYMALPGHKRLAYRCARNPFIFIAIMVPLQFLAINRLPSLALRSWKREWHSVWLTNTALAAVLAGVWLAFGAQRVLEVAIVQCMITCYGGALAAWLNHVQHQYEDAYWRRSAEWNFYEAGLQGASWFDLPKPLQWLTGNIGLHHVHHLSPLIPNYHLQRCHDENPELLSAHRITLRDGFKGLKLALWDERRRKLIPFSEVAEHTG